MYCQSKHKEKRPNPSLPLDPPNTRVKSWDVGFARQNTEKPVSKGKIHWGKSSHMKILYNWHVSKSENMNRQHFVGHAPGMRYRITSISSCWFRIDWCFVCYGGHQVVKLREECQGIASSKDTRESLDEGINPLGHFHEICLENSRLIKPAIAYPRN